MQIQDKNLSNPLTYFGDAIICVKYKCGNKEYMHSDTPTFRPNYYPYEVYAQVVDGIDVVGYYNNLASEQE